MPLSVMLGGSTDLAHSPAWKAFTTPFTFSLVAMVPGHPMLEETCRRFHMQHLTPSSGYITRKLILNPIPDDEDILIFA